MAMNDQRPTTTDDRQPKIDSRQPTTDSQQSQADQWSAVSGPLLAVGGRWSAVSGLLSAVARRIQANRKELDRFFKFCVVGVIGAVIDFGLLNIMMVTLAARHVDLGEWHVLGLFPLNGNLTLANTISFTTAVISNFTWNRFWTYPESRSKPLIGQLGQFFVVNIAGLAINLAVLNGLNPLATQLLGPLGYNAAKAVATGVVLFWNFFVNRFWTYNDVKLGN